MSESPRYRSLVWLAASAAACGAIAWVAVGLQKAGQAPLGIFSIGVGLAVGGVIVGIGRFLRIDGRWWFLCAAGVLSVATVATEHVLLYRDYVSAWHAHRAANPALEVFRPDATPKGLWEYLLDSAKTGAAEDGAEDGDKPAKRWLFWLVDLILVVVGAVFVVVASGRRQWVSK